MHSYLCYNDTLREHRRGCGDIWRCLIFFNVWDSIGEKILSTFLNSLWERVRVNPIFLPGLAGNVN